MKYMNNQNKGSAVWRGRFTDGNGTISTESGALNDYPYQVSSRFGLGDGSNPEELIGAAHASCFAMAFSRILEDAGLIAEKIETTATVTLDQVGDGFGITAVHLRLKAKIPDAPVAVFQKCAETAKLFCPVSKLINAPISLEADLVS